MTSPSSRPGNEPARTAVGLDSSSALCDVRQRDGVLRIRLLGPTIGRCEAPALVEAVGRAIEDACSTRSGRPRAVVLDFASVAMMSGMGLGMCVEIHRRSVARGLACGATGVNQHLRELFRMMKIDRLYTIVVSPDDIARLK